MGRQITGLRDRQSFSRSPYAFFQMKVSPRSGRQRGPGTRSGSWPSEASFYLPSSCSPYFSANLPPAPPLAGLFLPKAGRAPVTAERVGGSPATILLLHRAQQHCFIVVFTSFLTPFHRSSEGHLSASADTGAMGPDSEWAVLGSGPDAQANTWYRLAHCFRFLSKSPHRVSVLLAAVVQPRR
jgi:hypothetical protein